MHGFTGGEVMFMWFPRASKQNQVWCSQSTALLLFYFKNYYGLVTWLLFKYIY